jgi:hypothetical protein
MIQPLGLLTFYESTSKCDKGEPSPNYTDHPGERHSGPT